jgi:hypothetical protein
MGQIDIMCEWMWGYLKTIIDWTKVESDWLSFDSTGIKI